MLSLALLEGYVLLQAADWKGRVCSHCSCAGRVQAKSNRFIPNGEYQPILTNSHFRYDRQVVSKTDMLLPNAIR